MAQKENIGMGDVAKIQMTPPRNVGGKEYGAVLSATEKSMRKVAEMAVELHKDTRKPIMIILSDGGGNGT